MKLAQITKQLIFNQLQATPPPPLEKEGKRMTHKKQEARSKKQEARSKRQEARGKRQEDTHEVYPYDCLFYQAGAYLLWLCSI